MARSGRAFPMSGRGSILGVDHAFGSLDNRHRPARESFRPCGKRNICIRSLTPKQASGKALAVGFIVDDSQLSQHKTAVRGRFHDVRPGLFARAGNRIDRLCRHVNEDHLIVFDKRSVLFITALLALFAAAVVSKIHYSSIPVWDSILSERASGATASRVLWGTPKVIRIDEWRGDTPFILSQAARHFPTINYSLGPEKIPVLMGLPSKHFSALFQPQNWGFFVLGLERGFSFFWNYGVASILLSSFLLFMLVSRNRFWLSVFGTLFPVLFEFCPVVVLCFNGSHVRGIQCHHNRIRLSGIIKKTINDHVRRRSPVLLCRGIRPVAVSAVCDTAGIAFGCLLHRLPVAVLRVERCEEESGDARSCRRLLPGVLSRFCNRVLP